MFYILGIVSLSIVNRTVSGSTTLRQRCVRAVCQLWKNNKISLASKVKSMHSLVIFIFLYACESLNLAAEFMKRNTCPSDEIATEGY